MSAENAWRIARDMAADLCPALIGAYVRTRHMPPAFEAAFRAEVEAEAARAFEAGVRAGWQSSNEGFNSEHWPGPQSEQQTEDGVVERAVLARAALSRLEAKGESHE